MADLLMNAIASAGPYAYLYYVLGYVLTALSPVIPTPLVTALGGTAFGFWPAVWFGILGLGLGAVVSLGLARVIGRPVIAFLTRRPDLGDWEQLLGVSSLKVWGVLFFALNIDMVVLVSGLTSLPGRRLWLTAVLARTPWVVAVAWFGSSLLESRAALVIGLLAGAGVVVLLGLNAAKLRGRLLDWSRRAEASSTVPAAGPAAGTGTRAGSRSAVTRATAASEVAQTRVEDVADSIAQQVETDD
jgi:uncharacterized membrane protein YdjX (TVP38/TMEM64 family)